MAVEILARGTDDLLFVGNPAPWRRVGGTPESIRSVLPIGLDASLGTLVLGTRIVGRGTIDDRGSGTMIVRHAPENGTGRNDHSPQHGLAHSMAIWSPTRPNRS